MTEFLPIIASTSTVNIIEYDGCLWAACKVCRDKEINDYELTKKYVDWYCPQCEARVDGPGVDWVGAKIELDRPNMDLREWVAEWLNVPTVEVQVSISV